MLRDSSNTVAINLSANRTVSVSSLTGTPIHPSGDSPLPTALAMCSGGVVTRQRLAAWRAVNMRAEIVRARLMLRFVIVKMPRFNKTYR